MPVYYIINSFEIKPFYKEYLPSQPAFNGQIGFQIRVLWTIHLKEVARSIRCA